MNILNKLFRLLNSAGVEEQQFRFAMVEIRESNRKSLVMFSIIATVALLVMFGVSFLDPKLAQSHVLYACCAAASAVVFVLAKGPARYSHMMCTIALYGFIGMLMAFGILLGTVTKPFEITATYIALLLTVPQLFADRPWRMYLLILLSDAVFVLMVLRFKAPATWSSDIINACIFGAIGSIVFTYLTQIKVERLVLEETVRRMAETDQLTGLKNRNSYEKQLSSGKLPFLSSIFCIYVDINGLHELNNTKGHLAGDRMLQCVAEIFQRVLGREQTYRVGGDEYVAFGTDLSRAEAEEKAAAVRKAVEAAGYHAAIGLAYFEQNRIPLDKLVIAAEEQMFSDKASFYARTNPTRSSR